MTLGRLTRLGRSELEEEMAQLRATIAGTVAGVGIMVKEISDNTTTAYTDNASDASIIGNEILSFANGVPPAGLSKPATPSGE